jgi:hypothetical protein
MSDDRLYSDYKITTRQPESNLGALLYALVLLSGNPATSERIDASILFIRTLIVKELEK